MDRIQWRLLRVKDYLKGQLIPFFSHNVDTGVDKAIRVVDGTLFVVKKALLQNYPAVLLVETVDILRRWNVHGECSLTHDLMSHEQVWHEWFDWSAHATRFRGGSGDIVENQWDGKSHAASCIMFCFLKTLLYAGQTLSDKFARADGMYLLQISDRSWSAGLQSRGGVCSSRTNSILNQWGARGHCLRWTYYRLRVGLRNQVCCSENNTQCITCG